MCRVRAEAERKAVNSRIQGTAADLMKAAMLEWCRWQEAQGQPPLRIVAQVRWEAVRRWSPRAVSGDGGGWQ